MAEENAVVTEEAIDVAEKELWGADDAPEPVNDDAADPKAGEKPVGGDAPVKPEKVVPLGALHEERERRKELSQKLEQESEKRVRMEQRFEMLVQHIQNQASNQNQPKTVDKESDPVAYFDQKTQTQEERLAKFEAWQKQQEQQGQQNSQRQQFVGAYNAQAQQFASKQPDFKDAYTHFLTSVKDELTDAGFTDPQVIAQQMQSYEESIVGKAFQDKANPAERIYNLAKRRGYAPKVSDGEKTLNTVKAGQKAETSMSRAGGRSSNVVSLEQLAEITDPKEFDKAWERLVGPNS
jgi:hypothetical protein